MISEEATSQLRRLMELRDKRDTEAKAAKDSEKEYREAEAEVWESLMDSPQEGTLKVNLGEPYGVVQFLPQETYYGRIIDEDAALEGFEQRAMVEEMTKPQIVMARINEEVRACIEQRQPPPPGVDFYAKRYVRITRQKG